MAYAPLLAAGQLVQTVKIAVQRGNVDVRVRFGRRSNDVIVCFQAEEHAGVLGATDVKIAFGGRPAHDVTGGGRTQKGAPLRLVVPGLGVGVVEPVAFNSAGHMRDVGVVVAECRTRRGGAAEPSREFETAGLAVEHVHGGATDHRQELLVGVGAERRKPGMANLARPHLGAGFGVERGDDAGVADAVETIEVLEPRAGAAAAGVVGRLGKPLALEAVSGGLVVGDEHAFGASARRGRQHGERRQRGQQHQRRQSKENVIHVRAAVCADLFSTCSAGSTTQSNQVSERGQKSGVFAAVQEPIERRAWGRESGDPRRTLGVTPRRVGAPRPFLGGRPTMDCPCRRIADEMVVRVRAALIAEGRRCGAGAAEAHGWPGTTRPRRTRPAAAPLPTRFAARSMSRNLCERFASPACRRRH